MTGAIAVGPLFNGHPQTLRPFASNVTGARGDLVNIQKALAVPKIEIADPGEAIAGILKKAVTSASLGAQVNITPYLTFFMDNDNAGTTFDAGHANTTFFDIVGGTGAQVVDTSTADAIFDNAGSGQLTCLGYNPRSLGTTIGLYMINPKERQF